MTYRRYRTYREALGLEQIQHISDVMLTITPAPVSLKSIILSAWRAPHA